MTETPSAALRIVAGLGNPGEEYVGTRHNVGFAAVDRLAGRLGATFRIRGGKVAVADGRERPRHPFLLLKPMTFMNLSGEPLRMALSDLGGRPSDLLVLLDEFQLELGQVRIRGHGSDGGHNGLTSVIARLGTQRIPRLRMGIGPPPRRMPVDVFVLKRFPAADLEDVEEMVERAAEAAQEWVEGADLDSLMNRYNQR